MSIHKKILKTYETLFKYNKNNKFSQKRNRSFIHLYLLYIQNKYRFNFNFKNYPKNTKFYQCLEDLYNGIPTRNKKALLFPDDKLLGDIFFIKEDFNIEKFLVKLEEYTYNLNYVNTNIQIVDYLGNTENDVTVIKVAFSLLVFLEQFPDIKINSRLMKNITNHLVRVAEPIHGNLTYLNSQAVLILHNLHKIHKLTNYEKYINLILLSQDNNGLWKSGYNGYLVENAGELDILHTSIVLINLLDYQIIQAAKNLNLANSMKTNDMKTNDMKTNDIDIDIDIENKGHNNDDNKSSINDLENIEDNTNLNTKTESFVGKIVKKKKKHQEIIERFDNLSELQNVHFYFDLNFYNTTLILVFVLIAINFYRLKSKV
jgi:hypothetical protein